MTPIVETDRLGKRFRRHRRWALRDCTMTLPAERVVGLVGVNGAGKTTLLHLLAGLLRPTMGMARVLGASPGSSVDQRSRVGFLAQGAPLYDSLSIADHLRFGAAMNRRWDGPAARARVDALGLDPSQRAGELSGGQRAQVALTLALAKRPDLLILDEPVASLDPLARREFLQALMEAVATKPMTVVLSSHLLADLERVCDHLVVLTTGRVRLAGDVDDLLAEHRLLTGPRNDATLPGGDEVVQARHSDRQTTLLVRTDQPLHDPRWSATPIGLEDLVLAYMATDGGASRPDTRPLAVLR